jgi:hypothetical protein
MPASPERIAAERWFLTNGLPMVLRPGSLLRGVFSRSAPALAGFAMLMANSTLVVGITGKHTINIDGTPTRAEWFVLAVIVLVLPLVATAGWLVSRVRDQRTRRAIAGVSFVIALVGGIIAGPSTLVFVDTVLDVTVLAAIFLCTATGVGSLLGWAARMTVSNLASTGSLLVRALPVLLLTVLVFFNSPVWTMVSTVGRGRLWLALSFLFLVAVVFLVSNTLGRVRPILLPEAKSPGDAQALVGTPFESLPDRPRRVPLSRTERANVVFVLALSQTIQILTVALVIGLIYLVFGIILISPELLNAWTHGGSPDGQFIGMTLPIPNALIQICMFLSALTFMYLAAKAVSDKEYREQFIDPLLDEVRLTLVARDRYRAATAKAKAA